MFLKNNSPTLSGTGNGSSKKETIPTIVTRDLNILGNIVSEGTVDFDGNLDGNIRCNTLTLRANGSIKGEVVANAVFLYGKVRGLIRAKSVHLFASCNIEGIIMHETIAIEDGAFVDGKFKRTDKIQTEDDPEFSFDDGSTDDGEPKMLDNIRLIR